MITTYWSSKGGSGTTVTAVAATIAAAESSPIGAIGVDLGDDWPAVMGVNSPEGPSLCDWLESIDHVAHDALSRLESPIRVGDTTVGLLTGGPFTYEQRPCPAGALARLLETLRADGRPCFIAVAAAPGAHRAEVIAHSDRSILVTRACYLALRQVARARDRVDGVVLLEEPGRALSERDVTEVVGAPVVARIEVCRAIARSVDSGLFGRRLAREMRPLRKLVA